MFYRWLFSMVLLLSLAMPRVSFSQNDDLLDMVVTIIAATQRSTPSSQLLGVHAFHPDTHLAQLKESGAQIVRLPVTWHLMEEAGAGQTAQWFWDELDASVAAVEQAGAKLIIEMAQTPCWASSDPNKRCNDPTYSGYLKYPPTNPDDYGKAFARLAQRYKGRVFAYEIWNEPNFTGNWPPFGARPTGINDDYQSFIDLQAAQHYVSLVKATYSRLKAADPDASVLAGAIAGGDVAYVKEMYKAGVKGYFDALSIHPYTNVYPGERNSYGPDECPTGVREPKFWCFQVGVERIHQAMHDEGDNRKIWLTEFGFDSNTDWNGSGLTGQAEHLQRAVNLIRSWDFVPAACWYQLIDQNSSVNVRENQFGLFTSNLTIKPAEVAFKALVGTGNTNLKPIPLSPSGDIITTTPTFRWQAATGASSYQLWVNEYATPNVPGKIDRTYSSAEAGCSSGGICNVSPSVTLNKAAAEWWVTAISSSGKRVESVGTSFTIR